MACPAPKEEPHRNFAKGGPGSKLAGCLLRQQMEKARFSLLGLCQLWGAWVSRGYCLAGIWGEEMWGIVFAGNVHCREQGI